MYWMRMGKEGEAPASKQYQPSYSSRYVSRLDAISVAITVCRFLGGYSHNWHAFLLYMKLLTEAAMQREERSEIADLDEPSLCRLTLVHVEHSSQPISSADNHSTTSSPSMEGAEAICCACGYLINDRFILKVMEDNYHESCLRCAACHQSLASNPTCYTKNGHIYCQQDHTLLFGKRCRRCMRTLGSMDIVQRCMNLTYHSHCFTCYYCNSPFNKGDEYHAIDGEIFCPHDYHHVQQLQSGEHVVNLYEDTHHESSRKTPKRPRTILNAQQRRQFKSAFEKSAKPCRKVREQLAKETGLSVRVVQVWFQNQRAKMKKMNRKEGESDSYKGSANGEERSAEDVHSSEDEGFPNDQIMHQDSPFLDMDSDECDLIKSSSLTNLSNPIQKLYHMTSSQIYFPYSS